MTITATGSISGAAPAGLDASPAARRTMVASGFSVPEFQAAMPAPSTGEAATVRDVSVLLALQEDASDAAHARQAGERDARRHGRDLLRALSDLQRALLGAGGLSESLDSLDSLIRACPGDVADPGLAQAIRAIRLRAELELHRLRGPASTGRAEGAQPP